MGDSMMEALDKMNYPDVPDDLVENAAHDRVMREIQEERCGDSRLRHRGQRLLVNGMRSSQISALVMYLIKKGVLK